jgi:hypothetical protein
MHILQDGELCGGCQKKLHTVLPTQRLIFSLSEMGRMFLA